MKAAAPIALILALGARAGAAQPAELADYDPRSTAWNGLATFVGLAEGKGFTVDARATLQWDELTANDVLVLVYPLQKVEPTRLGAFVQAGGHVVIADDFGESHDALAALGMLRAEVVTPRASRYQDGRVWAPIATPLSEHPIANSVDEVVTNHPAALERVRGATVVIGFESSAVVVAGERGTGRFVAISDPSVFINRMLQYPGNVQLAVNVLDWLDRDDTGKRARRLVLVRGDAAMYGEPAPFIADPRGGRLARQVDEVNLWLWGWRWWFMTPAAMKVVASLLAVLLLVLAVLALPVRRGPRIDGAWLRFDRPVRRDEPPALVAASERGGARDGAPARGGPTLVLACILRDQVQNTLADLLGKPDPLYTLSESQLLAQLTAARGAAAADALARVYRRLRALPSRGQAAAPWSAGQLARRDFDTLYRDVAELCRTLGAPLQEARDVQEEAA